MACDVAVGISIASCTIELVLGCKALGVEHTTSQSTGEWKARLLMREVFIHIDCSGAAFLDAPDDQRLATTAIARGEDTLNVGAILALGRFDVATCVLVETKRLDSSLLGAQEAKSEEAEFGREDCMQFASAACRLNAETKRTYTAQSS